MKNQTTKANNKLINRSTKYCNVEKHWNQQSQQKRRTNNERLPESLKNGPQNQKMEARFDQKSIKMEPRGGKNRIGARKMTQDSVRQLPKPGYGVKLGLQNLPKSMKKSIEKSMTFWIALRFVFSSIFDGKMVPENENSEEKVIHKYM